jgi:predicted DNA-binding transcriptional regulator
MGSEHHVRFMCDKEMPDGHDWLLVEAEDRVICIVRRSMVSPKVLEEAWAGYRLLAAGKRNGLDEVERKRLDNVLRRIEQQLHTG